MEQTKQTEVKASRGPEMLRIPLSLIEVEEGFNARTEENYGDINSLAASILSMGQLKPVEVFKVAGQERYVLTDGHRRLRALKVVAEKAGTPDMLVLATKGSNSPVERLYSQILSNDGQKNTTYERAKIVERLLSEGEKSKDIQAKLGLNATDVHNFKTMLSAPEGVLAHLKNDAISGTTVVQIVKDNKGDDEAITAAVEEAIANATQEAREKGEPKKRATARHTNKLSTLPKMKRIREKLEKIKERNDFEELALQLIDALQDRETPMTFIMELVKDGPVRYEEQEEEGGEEQA